MKNNLLKNILSIALVILLSVIIPSAAAFAAVDPIIVWPSASNIIYGQSLADSNFSGGSADIVGSFVFEDPTIKPSAGSDSFSVMFIPSDPVNYNQVISSVNVVTEKADATINITGFTGTYDGQPHSASASADGIEGEDLSGLLVLGESYTDVPGGTATWTFMGDENYNEDSGSVDIIIDPLDPIVIWPSASNIVYGQSLADSNFIDGSADTEGSIIFEDPTIKPNFGTAAYTVKFLPLDVINYNQVSDSINVITEKAEATIDIAGYTGTSDGQYHGATGTAVGIYGENLTNFIHFGDTFSDAPGGTANWSFTGNDNYEDEFGSVEIIINEATIDPIVIWPSASNIIYGQSLADSNFTDGSANTEGTFVFENPTIKPSAGSDTFSVMFIPSDLANYNQVISTVNVVTEKADALISITGFTGNYDGLAHGATGWAEDSINGEDLSSLLVFGETFVNVPGGTATWNFIGNANYNEDSGLVEIVINKERANIYVYGADVEYDGEEHGATGGALGMDNIDLSQGFDFSMTFVDVPGGTALWTFDGGINYEDESGLVEIYITKADLGGAMPTASNIIYGQSLADSNLSEVAWEGSFVFEDPMIKPNAGTAAYTVIFIPFDTINYNQFSDVVYVQTEKAHATIDITGYTGTYDGQHHGATGTAFGIHGENLTNAIDFGNTFSDAPGGTANWSFTGGANYEDINGSVEITIDQAIPVLTWPTATITIGQILESAVLSGGMSSVPGTFTFDNPLSIPAPGNFEFDAMFTPEDTLNYETLAGKIKVATPFIYSGILHPIKRDGSSIFKAGSTVPVKFQLFNLDGVPISTAVVRISYVKITDGVAGAMTEAISTSAATTGNLFRYDTKSQQYIFNLNTKGMKAGTYELRIQLDDGSIQTVRVGLR